MKRILLSMALAAAMAAPVSAQWVNDPAQCNIVSPAGSNNYGYDIQTNANGMTYVFMQIPHNETIEMRLQILDKDGVKTLPEEGQLISAEANQTWTKVNQHLLIDRDGNAVIAVFDFRKGNETYTIYKYDETGKELWARALTTSPWLPCRWSTPPMVAICWPMRLIRMIMPPRKSMSIS